MPLCRPNRQTDIYKTIWKEHKLILKMKDDNPNYIAVHFLLFTDM